MESFLEVEDLAYWSANSTVMMKIYHQMVVYNILEAKQVPTKSTYGYYLAHVIEQPNLRILNPQYLQPNFCFDFFNDSENTF